REKDRNEVLPEPGGTAKPSPGSSWFPPPATGGSQTPNSLRQGGAASAGPSNPAGIRSRKRRPEDRSGETAPASRSPLRRPAPMPSRPPPARAAGGDRVGA